MSRTSGAVVPGGLKSHSIPLYGICWIGGERDFQQLQSPRPLEPGKATIGAPSRKRLPKYRFVDGFEARQMGARLFYCFMKKVARQPPRRGSNPAERHFQFRAARFRGPRLGLTGASREEQSIERWLGGP